MIIKKIKLFWTYIGKLILSLFLLNLSYISLQIARDNLIENYEIDVHVTVYDKFEDHYTIVYNTDDNIKFFEYTNPAIYSTSNIGDDKILDIVNKNKLGKETPNVFSFLFWFFIFLIIGLFNLITYFINLIYIYRNGEKLISF